VYILLLILLLPFQIIIEIMKLNKWDSRPGSPGRFFFCAFHALPGPLIWYPGPGDIATATGPGWVPKIPTKIKRLYSSQTSFS